MKIMSKFAQDCCFAFSVSVQFLEQQNMLEVVQVNGSRHDFAKPVRPNQKC